MRSGQHSLCSDYSNSLYFALLPLDYQYLRRNKFRISINSHKYRIIVRLWIIS